MALELLGGPTNNTGSPRLWVDSDRGLYYVQGYEVPGHADRVEIPHMLLRWLQPGTCLGTQLHDAGDGAFTLAGRQVTDEGVLAKMQIPAHEIAVEVPVAASKWEW